MPASLKWDGTSSAPRHELTADEVEQLQHCPAACRPLYDGDQTSAALGFRVYSSCRSHPLAAVVSEGIAHCWWQLARMHLVFLGLPVDAPGIEQAPAHKKLVATNQFCYWQQRRNTHGTGFRSFTPGMVLGQSGVPMAWRE